MFEKVKEVIINTLNCSEEKVTIDARLSEDLGADSLDAVELNLAIEEEFNITIDDETMQTIKTVQDIVNIVESNK